MSNFWYRVRRRRCSISTSVTKLDFKVPRGFCSAFANSATAAGKSWIICRRIPRFLRIFSRDSYAANVQKELLFLVEIIAVRDN